MFVLLNLLIIVILGAFAGGVTSYLAGRWDLWNVWANAAIFVISLSFQTLALHFRSPELLRERIRPAAPSRVKFTTSQAFVLLSIVQWLIAGLDLRNHWSDIIPPGGVVAGLVILILSWVLVTWATLTNPFFSPAVRIQDERGQRVVSGGLYAIVRHPGYATIALTMLASALLLNSLLSLIPALIYVAITVRVTAFEDRMLREELAGYGDYAAKVRYRLIPGLW